MVGLRAQQTPNVPMILVIFPNSQVLDKSKLPYIFSPLVGECPPPPQSQPPTHSPLLTFDVSKYCRLIGCLGGLREEDFPHGRGEQSLPWRLPTLRCKDFLQWKQSYKLPVRFTLCRVCGVVLRTGKRVCVFGLYNQVAEELYFLACFLSWRLQGPPVGCLARGLARSGLAQAFDEWTRNSSREGETLRWSAESQELGSEPLETEDSAWCACIHLPKGQ